jgi:hypothetical protein
MASVYETALRRTDQAGWKDAKSSTLRFVAGMEFGDCLILESEEIRDRVKERTQGGYRSGTKRTR